MSDEYRVEDKAREILNVFKERGIDLKSIDFALLEKVLKEADMKKII